MSPLFETIAAEPLVPALCLAIILAIVAVCCLLVHFMLRSAQAKAETAALRESEARLRSSEGRFRQLADATFEGLIIHRDGIVLDANTAMAAITGWPQALLIGRSLYDLCPPATHDALRAELFEIRCGRGPEAGDAPVEFQLRHADGSTIPVEVHARTLPFETGDARVIAVRDIRERKAAEERILHLAHHDALTGLPNRNLFRDRLAQAMARARRSGSTVAVLCLDLDRFKPVNDLLGPEIADELLRQVALRLTQSTRADDTVARLGADEFALIQVGLAHPDGPAFMADRLVKAISEPFVICGHHINIGTSIGIALFPSDGMSGDELLRAADTALGRAKEAGGSAYRFFESEMDLRLQERRRLERDLRHAVNNDQLELHYQPLVDCAHLTVTGCEALLRWHHPERGPISPCTFIPLAEECGLIMQLGEWVLRTACRETASWPDDKIVAVNLSPIQFRQSDLADQILGILAETGLAPHRLELEITEGVLIEDTERVLATLKALKAHGIRISLDDFGTGYSSLSYLHRFPFDKIKIDRSFIWAMEENSDSMSIVRAVIALGRSLRITVTAEGVETPTQLAWLQAEDCDQAQGYLLGKPMSRADIATLWANAQGRAQAELPLIQVKAAE
ncbi:putative bifunctional diguanylate cyclase/phosphodiesterase [Dongia rigui]|uniref:EAL domain-containing protein n=1 Tax=Dongia rigui TaxID=940149 RepID=A0ABU5DWM4_9PROT|nr:EAL domain-containing protein [Dongia rigui]MDY0871695.1 EAL domain-containing protein [Dongia rigui]